MQWKKRTIYLFFGILVLIPQSIQATVLGSDNKIGAELSFFTFPASQLDNRLALYGIAGKGFALENKTTSAVFDSIFPVGGTIDLNGGTLTLNCDLIMKSDAHLKGLGTVNGLKRKFVLSDNVTSLPTNTVLFKDTKIVLNNDITVSSSITFTGICHIEGNGYQLTLGANGELKAANNSVLVLHNIILNGIHDTNVKCLNDFSLIILDNAHWIQSADTNFLIGALQFRNKVVMSGKSTFSYQTLKTSLVRSNAMLMLDAGFTFSYDPIRLGSKTLLQFSDNTASLFLNGATLHTTTTGMNLTGGSLIVRGNSVLSSQITINDQTTIDQGITLGDGISSANDFECTILSGARLQLNEGSLNYKNINNSSWLMENSLSMLNLGNDTTLRLYNSLNLGYGVALCNPRVTIARVPQAPLVGSVSAVSDLFFVQL